MLKATRRTLVVIAAVLWAVGCSSITDPAEIGEFRWSPMDDPETRVQTANAYSAVSTLYIQGVVTTPSHCYGLSGDFQKEGNALSLRIGARPVSGTNCDVGVGAFEYTALIVDLDRRTYDLRVVHDVEGVGDSEFNLTVTVVK